MLHPAHLIHSISVYVWLWEIEQGFYAWTLTTTVVSDYTQTPRLLANNAMQVRRQLKVTDNSRD